MASISDAASSSDKIEEEPPLVMQIIMSKSLIGSKEWSLGPLLAQASHASTAIIAQGIQSNDKNTLEYTSTANLLKMHKVLLQTGSKGYGSDLLQLSQKLKEAQDEDNTFPRHHLWIEQPENVPTCIAIAPNRKPAALKKILNKCSLLRE
ncbi:unnamed protein product [Sympodiomycopsis kandeliae]